MQADSGPLARAEYNSFVVTAKQAFVEKAVADVLSRFRAANGVMELLKGEAPASSTRLLLDMDSKLWEAGTVLSPMETLLREAGQIPEVQKNAWRLMDIASGRHEISLAIDLRELQAVLRNERAVIALWNAAVAQPLQYRMLSETRSIRRRVIDNGVEEALLPFPDWLHTGEENDGKRRSYSKKLSVQGHTTAKPEEVA
jgi:hypothetical protein